MLSDQEPQGITLNKFRCVKCLTCYRICPFDAILLKTDKVTIDIDKCQLCGMCASACPAYAIDTIYYDTDTLIDHIKTQKEKLGTDTLVLMCRGSTPPSCEILELLKEHEVTSFIPLRIPCVGRVTVEFYLQTSLLGIEKFIVIQCDDASCRMKNGSDTSIKTQYRFKEILQELGGEDDRIILIQNPLKAEYFTDKCVGCDKCVFICPYEAIVAQPLATPTIDPETCRGCGACALVCPHLAIELRGFEFETSVQALKDIKADIDLKTQIDKPKLLVFCCQWSEYSALDQISEGQVKENVSLVEVPCANGLDPVQVIDALQLGFDGVMAFVCSNEDCKLKEGRQSAEANFFALAVTLKKLGLSDRFELCETSPRDLDNFNSKLEAFITKLSARSKTSPGGEQ